MTLLTAAHRRAWDERGVVVLRDALDRETVEDVTTWAGEVEAWSTGADGPGMHHFEATDGGVRVARSEDFDPHHRPLSDFVRRGLIADVLAELLGEPAVLFKEKINYKHPGGGGFAPHQDATAYRFVDRHVSVMVPIDAATTANGCLWFADEHVDRVLPHDAGRIDHLWVEAATWVPVEVDPGDLVVFDSLAPHRSDTNDTDRSRRAMYLTYNAASAGDLRDRYYADKRATFASTGPTGSSGNVLLSINDDFLGRPVAAPGGERP
ncbi:MAG: phytanoyl-CoA dioxygenase family protein [Actinomycetota bacterium]|nr:phytanoyl-CoA dioxygenase family protein [Actinomycetota bacterium]